jgi:hypothetical protein
VIGKIVNVRCPLCGGEMQFAPKHKKLVCYRRECHTSGACYSMWPPIDLQLRLMHSPELPGLEEILSMR